MAIDLDTGRVRWKSSELPGDWRGDLSFSLDGSTVLAKRSDSKSRNVWLSRLDVVTGERRGEPMGGWSWMAVAPDGRTAVTGRFENREVYVDVFDLPKGQRTASWLAGRQRLSDFVYSPDGKSLFAQFSEVEGAGFNQYGYGQVLDVATGRPNGPLMAGTASALTPPRAIVS